MYKQEVINKALQSNVEDRTSPIKEVKPRGNTKKRRSVTVEVGSGVTANSGGCDASHEITPIKRLQNSMENLHNSSVMASV